MKRAVSERMMSHRAELSNKALAKYLPVFSVLALGGTVRYRVPSDAVALAGDTPNMICHCRLFLGAG